MNTFTKGFAFLVIGCSVALVGCSGDKGAATSSTTTSTTSTPAPDATKPDATKADATTPAATTADAGGVTGHYTVSITMPPAKNPNDPGEKMGQSMAESMMKTSSLDIKADNTFAMTMMSIPMEGTWKSADKKIVLTPTKIMGKTFEEMRKADPKAKIDEKPLELTVGADGKLTAADPSGRGQNMVFTKGK